MVKPTSNRRFPYPGGEQSSYYEVSARNSGFSQTSSVQLEVFPVNPRRSANEHFMNFGLSEPLVELINPDVANGRMQPKHVDSNYEPNQFAWISLTREQAEELMIALAYALHNGKFDK